MAKWAQPQESLAHRRTLALVELQYMLLDKERTFADTIKERRQVFESILCESCKQSDSLFLGMNLVVQPCCI